MRRSWSVWLGNVLQSSRGRSGSAILSAHDLQMAELDASWRAALAHVCFTAKGRGPKVGVARGAEFKVIPRCGFGRSRARNTNIPRRTQNRICTDMYAQASVYTCSRVGRICRHQSQATSFDGRQLTRYSTQKILMLSPGDWATFFLHGGRVSSGVAERTLSFIKALDSAWKTLEPCDRELLHHTQFMPMLFRWLRRHK